MTGRVPIIRLVLQHLQAYRGCLVTVGEIADAVYARDPTGGPLNPKAAVRTAVRRLRAQGHRIDNHFWRGYCYMGNTGAELTHPPGIVVQGGTTHEDAQVDHARG